MNRTELLKIAKPILFNTDMVRAIQDGRKTVTRINPFNFEMKEGYNPDWSGYSLGEYYTGCIETGVCLYSRGAHDVWGVRSNVVKPKYRKDDILYVRETWVQIDNEIMYKADDEIPEGWHLTAWKPSVHMPKSAARIFLKVTDVRVERLQDITVEQAIKEGFKGIPCGCSTTGCTDCYDFGWREPPQDGFMYTWDSTIKKQDLDKYGWDANPWAWVYEFERMENNENNND